MYNEEKSKWWVFLFIMLLIIALIVWGWFNRASIIMGDVNYLNRQVGF